MKLFVYLFLQFLFYECKDIIYNHTKQENNLYFVFTTFREGATTNYLILDSFGNLVSPIGTLTKYGEIQNLEIGKKYRSRYSNFLNMSFDNNQIIIQSSNVEKVLNSAEKQLEGFFNKTINITYINKIDDGRNIFELYNLNDKEAQELEKYERFCEKRRRLDNDSLDYNEYFKKEIAPILKDCYGIYFTLSLHFFCDSTFSAYYEYIYNNDTKNKIGKCGMKNITKIYDFCLNWHNSFNEWDEYGAYMFYMFYQNIFSYMNKSINGNSPVKMMMIGGHENTLVKFMHFLDGLKIIEKTEYPKFGYNIVIELRKYNYDFYLEFYYNDILKYNDTLLSFQNILNQSKYNNLYNYCGIPYWMKNNTAYIQNHTSKNINETQDFKNDTSKNQNENENNKNITFKNKNDTIDIKNITEGIKNITFKNKNETEDIKNITFKNKNDTKGINNITSKNKNGNENIQNGTSNNDIRTNLIKDIKKNETIKESNSPKDTKYLNNITNLNGTSTNLSAKLNNFVKKNNILFFVLGCSILIILLTTLFIIIICVIKKKKKKDKEFIKISDKKSKSKNNLSFVSV